MLFASLKDPKIKVTGQGYSQYFAEQDGVQIVIFRESTSIIDNRPGWGAPVIANTVIVTKFAEDKDLTIIDADFRRELAGVWRTGVKTTFINLSMIESLSATPDKIQMLFKAAESRFDSYQQFARALEAGKEPEVQEVTELAPAAEGNEPAAVH